MNEWQVCREWTVSRWCFNYGLLPTCHWKGAPAFDVNANFSIIKFAGPIADMCGATWSQELADLVPGRGTMGARRDNHLLHLNSSRERVWRVMKYFGFLHKTNDINTLFQSIWEYFHWYSANSKTVNLVLLLQPLHCILISSANWIWISTEGWQASRAHQSGNKMIHDHQNIWSD